MTYEAQGRIFKYVYLALGAVFFVSLFLLAFMKGVTPFNTNLSWSDGSLVLTQFQAGPAVGKRVARAGSIEGQVLVYRVRDSYREGGELYYRAEPAAAPGTDEVIAARSAQHVVLATVPLLGFWVRALGNPVGALVLLGIPLLTFALDLILTSLGAGFMRGVMARVARTVGVVRRMRNGTRKTAAAEPVEIEEDVYEEAYEEMAETTYSGPRTVPQQYGMTITLSRPRRYSM
jgi:hypothetical protein